MRIRRTLAQIQVDLVDLSPSTQEPLRTHIKNFYKLLGCDHFARIDLSVCELRFYVSFSCRCGK